MKGMTLNSSAVRYACVIGAGLAGVEAAWALAKQGIPVTLYEMKPVKYTPAHHYEGFAELVCSNSLKAERKGSAAGMLKEEMLLFGSLIIEAAEKTKVPAGGALAVNRKDFSDYITAKIKENPHITIKTEEVTSFPQKNTVIATGPLTSDSFAESIREKCGEALSFYDAAAPIVTAESIDMERAFYAARYDRGDADYINCPMNKEEYESFYQALVNAKTAELHDFEKEVLPVYEGCMPVEILAKRGIESVRYGCMKPVGLKDPRTGHRPWAAVQLRKENREGTLYNMVGFQTNLKFPEQKRVFGMIPGLQNAVFARYGVMHRNTFLNSPKLLDSKFMLKGSDGVYFAGQMTGVEGYTESALSGIIAGNSLAARINCVEGLKIPEGTMTYALCRHVTTENQDFQPMGANMGLLPPLDENIKNKQERYQALADRGLERLRQALQWG